MKIKMEYMNREFLAYLVWCVHEVQIAIIYCNLYKNQELSDYFSLLLPF